MAPSGTVFCSAMKYTAIIFKKARGRHSIEKIVRRGQEVMVQVTKEPFMKKGAMLTTYISLAGRHLVLMPGSDRRGFLEKSMMKMSAVA